MTRTTSAQNVQAQNSTKKHKVFKLKTHEITTQMNLIN